MPLSKKPTVSLEEVKVRFEEWRRNRKGKARYRTNSGLQRLK
jgi:hypothetical protein